MERIELENIWTAPNPPSSTIYRGPSLSKILATRLLNIEKTSQLSTQTQAPLPDTRRTRCHPSSYGWWRASEADLPLWDQTATLTNSGVAS